MCWPRLLVVVALVTTLVVGCSCAPSSPPKLRNEGCVQDPSQPVCANYTMPSAMVQQGISTNCNDMYMAGCTIERICTANGASRAVTRSPYCGEFSVLKDLCVDMPGMGGCKNYTSMCSNVSVVAACHTIKALPLPKTMALSTTVENMCNSMYMPPCDQCITKKGMLPPCDILQVYSDLCLSMWMDGCEGWRNLCQVIPEWPLCSSDSEDNPPPMMRMYFHASLADYVLIKELVPRNWWQYSLTVVGILLLGILYELLKVSRSVWEGQLLLNNNTNHHDHSIIINNNGSSSPSSSDENEQYDHHDHQGRGGGWDWRVEIPRAVMAFAETLLGMLLMLVAMTFNVGLFLAVCAGPFFGSLLFSRYANLAYVKHGCH